MSALTELAEVISRCAACTLCQTRTKAVPGEGPENAAIMFIGEGPGRDENRTGRPFVGAAGQFLSRLLAANGIDRSSVFITNVVKCWPPGNRDPLPEEIAACRTYLDQQLAIIKPKVVVTLGRYSMARWFPGQSISRIHGQPKVFDGLTVVPMFHPAAALHQERYRSLIEADFARLPAILAAAVAVKEEAPPAPPPKPEPKEEVPAQQMRLF
jgi:DNA polymerase